MLMRLSFGAVGLRHKARVAAQSLHQSPDALQDPIGRLWLRLVKDLEAECDGSVASVARLSEVQGHLEEQPPCHHLLGQFWARALTSALKMACQALQRSASEDYQAHGSFTVLQSWLILGRRFTKEVAKCERRQC